MSIRRLPDKVISQIAAGEVVERPSHMVKELVENAIDAGATRVDVDVDEGGRYVQVIDDGEGISPEELPLVFERHATSKITEVEDLWRLGSFGFRGEALASLAAVSRVQLVSMKEKQSTAYRLDVEFGDLQQVTSSSGAKGTRILIQDLFENLPARKKFLKSATAEVGQIKTTLKAIALIHPEVEFKVRHKGGLVFNWPRTSHPVQRIQDVLGVEPMHEVLGEVGHYKVRAFYSSPKQVMRQSKGLWIFAQKRWIVDRGLQAAVMDAYHSLLMHGEYPYCVVDLQCAEDEIDVNVHPTKSQVKFRDPSTAFRAVRGTLRRGLEAAPWIPKAMAEKKSEDSQGARPPDVQYSAPMTPLHFKEPEFYRTHFQQKSSWQPEPQIKEVLAGFSSQAGLRLDPQASETDLRNSGSNEETKNLYWSHLQILGQCNLTYIIAQDSQNLVLVDQHAAHERVQYEKLFRDYRNKSTSAQQLLVPLTLDLTGEKADALWSVREELKELAVELEWAGPETLCLHSRPWIIGEDALLESLMTFADDIVDKGGSISLEKHIAHIIATMACHSSVRAGQALSLEQMKKLLAQMDEFPLSSFCPHGRPVSVEYSYQKLERDFGRTV